MTFFDVPDFCHIKYFEFHETFGEQQHMKPAKLRFFYNFYMISIKVLFFSGTLSVFWHEVLL